MKNSRFSLEAKVDQETMTLVVLACEMAKIASQENKKYFIGSGLAIDLSLGKISRNHNDIDFHPMLTDLSWWIQWFKDQGLVVKKIEGSQFPETYNVFNQKDEMVVDLWPMNLKEGILFINQDGKYVDAGRHWEETRMCEFNEVIFRLENPQRVLEQKLRHVKQGQPLRDQDIHDFQLMGQSVEI